MGLNVSLKHINNNMEVELTFSVTVADIYFWKLVLKNMKT